MLSSVWPSFAQALLLRCVHASGAPTVLWRCSCSSAPLDAHELAAFQSGRRSGAGAAGKRVEYHVAWWAARRTSQRISSSGVTVGWVLRRGRPRPRCPKTSRVCSGRSSQPASRSSRFAVLVVVVVDRVAVGIGDLGDPVERVVRCTSPKNIKGAGGTPANTCIKGPGDGGADWKTVDSPVDWRAAQAEFPSSCARRRSSTHMQPLAAVSMALSGCLRGSRRGK